MSNEKEKVELRPGETTELMISGNMMSGQGQYGEWIGWRVVNLKDDRQQTFFSPPALVNQLKAACLAQGDQIQITTTAVPGMKGRTRKEYRLKIQYVGQPGAQETTAQEETEIKKETAGPAEAKPDNQEKENLTKITDPIVKEYAALYLECLRGSIESWRETGIYPNAQQLGASAATIYIRVSEIKLNTGKDQKSKGRNGKHKPSVEELYAEIEKESIKNIELLNAKSPEYAAQWIKMLEMLKDSIGFIKQAEQLIRVNAA